MKKINFIKILTIVFVCLFMQNIVSAQVSSAAKGTYQFIFKERDMQEQINLTSEQLVKLENLRHNELDVYVVITEKTIIKLLPGNLVYAPQFIAANTEEFLFYLEINPDDFGGIDIYKQAVTLK